MENVMFIMKTQKSKRKTKNLLKEVQKREKEIYEEQMRKETKVLNRIIQP